MRAVKLQVLLLSFLLVSASKCNNEVDPTDTQAKLEQTLDGLLDKQDIPGMAVGVVYDDKIFTYGTGESAEGEVDPMTTHFRLASLSKVINGTLAHVAQEKGMIALNKDIRTYFTTYKIPTKYIIDEDKNLETVPDGSFITTYQLLNHSAGIQHYDNSTKGPYPPNSELAKQTKSRGFEWALKYMTSNPLVSLPGKKYSYSSMGHNLAGVVLEYAAGMSYEYMIEEWINKPLGIKIKVDWPDVAIPDPAQDRDTEVSWKAPSGGLTVTAYDMTRFCQGLINNQIMGQAAFDKMTKNKSGIMAGGQTYGETSYWHNGSHSDAGTYILMLPKSKFCMVILTNKQYAGLNVGEIEDAITEALMAE